MQSKFIRWGFLPASQLFRLLLDLCLDVISLSCSLNTCTSFYNLIDVGFVIGSWQALRKTFITVSKFAYKYSSKLLLLCNFSSKTADSIIIVTFWDRKQCAVTTIGREKDSFNPLVLVYYYGACSMVIKSGLLFGIFWRLALILSCHKKNVCT